MFFLVVISGLCWALFDASRKVLSAHHKPVSLGVALVAAQTACFFVWWAVSGATQIPATTDYWVPSGVRMVTESLASGLFLYALRNAPMAECLPMLSFAPVFSALVAFFYLVEQLLALQLTGIACVTLGALIINSGGYVKQLKFSKGSLAMLVVAFCWGGASVVDKQAMLLTSPPAHALVQCFGVFVILGLFAGKEWKQAIAIPKRPAFWLATALSCVALASQLQALASTDVATFESSKRAIGLVSSLMIGSVFFKEKVTRWHWIGAAMMALGVTMVLR